MKISCAAATHAYWLFLKCHSPSRSCCLVLRILADRDIIWFTDPLMSMGDTSGGRKQ